VAEAQPTPFKTAVVPLVLSLFRDDFLRAESRTSMDPFA